MKPTMKQMADELSRWHKENNYHMQYTIKGRRIFFIDYSIPINRKEYGIAPIYVQTISSAQLKHEYSLMKKGLIK